MHVTFQAPMNDCWQNIIVGMKVEVENRDTDHHTGLFSNSYWVASVLRISGYYAHLRYEGFGQDGTKDFWMNLCSDRVHPVGWCATKGKPLIPPKCKKTFQIDYFLVKSKLSTTKQCKTAVFSHIFVQQKFSTFFQQFKPNTLTGKIF